VETFDVFLSAIHNLAYGLADDGTDNIEFNVMLTHDGAVIVMTHPSQPMDDVTEERFALLAKMGVKQIQRNRAILACPEHRWDFEFDAVYLDGAKDALCQCGARRSEVKTPA
jgi:hypothetical protein